MQARAQHVVLAHKAKNPLPSFSVAIPVIFQQPVYHQNIKFAITRRLGDNAVSPGRRIAILEAKLLI